MFKVIRVKIYCTVLLSKVTALKKKLEIEKGKDGYPADGMKLIYAGR